MDEDDRELVRQLFAATTGLLEDASQIAASGQPPTPDPLEYTDSAYRLHLAGQRITTLAKAILVIPRKARQQSSDTHSERSS